MLTRRGFVLGGGGLMLTACSGAPLDEQPSQAASVSLEHLPKFTFDAGTISVEDQSGPAASVTDAHDRLPLLPSDMARDWAQDRLAVTGQRNGKLRFSILQADTFARAEGDDFHRSFRTKRRSDDPLYRHDRYQRQRFARTRYECILRVLLEYRSGVGESVRSEVLIERERIVSEALLLVQRDSQLLQLVTDLQHDLNVAMEREIQEKFTPYLI